MKSVCYDPVCAKNCNSNYKCALNKLPFYEILF